MDSSLICEIKIPPPCPFFFSISPMTCKERKASRKLTILTPNCEANSFSEIKVIPPHYFYLF